MLLKFYDASRTLFGHVVDTVSLEPNSSQMFRRVLSGGLGVALALMFSACQSHYPPPLAAGRVPERACPVPKKPTHSVFLIGDAGEPQLPEHEANALADPLVDPLLLQLRGNVENRVAELGADRVSVVFLGDNVYPVGLVPEGDPDRERGERVLRAQIASVGSARGYFLAGNHDWHREGSRGYEYIIEQRKFLQQFTPRIQMAPPGGCVGPQSTEVGDHLRLVFFDFIAAFYFWENRDAQQDCPHGGLLNAFFDLEEQFKNHDGRHVVFLNHYPIITTGPHGGHFTWKQHIFPLTDFWPWAWVPLPIIGSAYPLSRQWGVTGTDLSSEQYERFLRIFWRTSDLRSPILIVGGHEHSLQVHRDVTGVYYLVSGAGSIAMVEKDRVEERDTMLIGVAKPGYMRLDVMSDGALELSVFTLGDSEPVYRQCVAGVPSPRLKRRDEQVDMGSR